MDKDITWKEFKEAIEKQGVKDDDEIAYIDMRGTHMPKVKKYERGAFRVEDGAYRFEDE